MEWLTEINTLYLLGYNLSRQCLSIGVLDVRIPLLLDATSRVGKWNRAF